MPKIIDYYDEENFGKKMFDIGYNKGKEETLKKVEEKIDETYRNYSNRANHSFIFILKKEIFGDKK